jgi:hypothetical protein
VAFAGINQFTREVGGTTDCPRWISASGNVQFLTPVLAGLHTFLQAGTGSYWPKSGSAEFGFNAAPEVRARVGSLDAVELDADCHQIQTTDPVRFLTLQIGLLASLR